MLRLLSVRTQITLLKRAIAISGKLKPRTWVYLTLTQALLAAVCFWGYSRLPNIKSLPPGPSLAQRYSVYVEDSCSVSGHVAIIQALMFKENLALHESIVLQSDLENSPYTAAWQTMASRSCTNFASWRLGSSWVWMNDSTPLIQQVRKPEVIILQLSSPESKSQIDAWLKTMALIQGIFLTIGSALGSIFAWLGYRRGRADLKLKNLQIREMEIRLENMERDRARTLQEASKSSIILIS